MAVWTPALAVVFSVRKLSARWASRCASVSIWSATARDTRAAAAAAGRSTADGTGSHTMEDKLGGTGKRAMGNPVLDGDITLV